MDTKDCHIEYILILIKPDAMESGKDKEILVKIGDVIQITFSKQVVLTAEDVYVIYPDKVGANFFPKLLDFLTSGVSTLIIGKGRNAGALMQRLKDQIRADVLINITNEDLQLLRLGTHPKQDEITNVNALRNLIHVSCENDGAVEQITSLLGKEYL